MRVRKIQRADKITRLTSSAVTARLTEWSTEARAAGEPAGLVAVAEPLHTGASLARAAPSRLRPLVARPALPVRARIFWLARLRLKAARRAAGEAVLVAAQTTKPEREWSFAGRACEATEPLCVVLKGSSERAGADIRHAVKPFSEAAVSVRVQFAFGGTGLLGGAGAAGRRQTATVTETRVCDKPASNLVACSLFSVRQTAYACDKVAVDL